VYSLGRHKVQLDDALFSHATEEVPWWFHGGAHARDSITYRVNLSSGADQEQSLSNEEFVISVMKKIDYQVRHQDAMKSTKAVQGKIVKWHGRITEIREDNIMICGRMVLIRPRDGSPVPYYVDRNDPMNYNFFENFLFTLDHPLPEETRIGDMTESGVNLTLPVLQGYAIAKDNDRNFQNPVWIGNIDIE
jgi:hypothetical protein